MESAVDSQTLIEVALIVSAAFQNIALIYVTAKFHRRENGPNRR